MRSRFCPWGHAAMLEAVGWSRDSASSESDELARVVWRRATTPSPATVTERLSRARGVFLFVLLFFLFFVFFPSLGVVRVPNARDAEGRRAHARDASPLFVCALGSGAAPGDVPEAAPPLAARSAQLDKTFAICDSRWFLRVVETVSGFGRSIVF